MRSSHAPWTPGPDAPQQLGLVLGHRDSIRGAPRSIAAARTALVRTASSSVAPVNVLVVPVAISSTTPRSGATAVSGSSGICSRRTNVGMVGIVG